MKMKTCKCGQMMPYNSYYHMYECQACDTTYNAAGQELRPVAEWKDEYEEGDY